VLGGLHHDYRRAESSPAVATILHADRQADAGHARARHAATSEIGGASARRSRPARAEARAARAVASDTAGVARGTRDANAEGAAGEAVEPRITL
jgi:hypothetical protein